MSGIHQLPGIPIMEYTHKIDDDDDDDDVDIAAVL